jgi:hypothetical protein
LKDSVTELFQHLHGAVVTDFDVGGLQVAVDDALLVRGLERLGDLFRHRRGVINGRRCGSSRDDRDV